MVGGKNVPYFFQLCRLESGAACVSAVAERIESFSRQ